MTARAPVELIRKFDEAYGPLFLAPVVGLGLFGPFTGNLVSKLLEIEKSKIIAMIPI